MLRALLRATSEIEVKDAKSIDSRVVWLIAGGSGRSPLSILIWRSISIRTFPDTYIDRAIVFHRIGDMKRELADVAQAKRIDELKLQ